jgi:hypothetical protein
MALHTLKTTVGQKLIIGTRQHSAAIAIGKQEIISALQGLGFIDQNEGVLF